MSPPGQPPTIQHATQCLRAGDLDQAETIARRLLKRNKHDVAALQVHGAVAMERHDYNTALKHYRKCIGLRPGEARFHLFAGKACALQGRHLEALAFLDKALSLSPGDRAAAEWKATVHQWDGDYEAALRELEPFVRDGNENANMAQTYARALMHQQHWQDAADLLQRHLAGEVDASTRHRLGHVAGDAYEKLGEYDRAFEAHTEANRAVETVFDPAEHARLVDRLIEVFSAPLVEQLSAHGNESPLPGFIAGMPRSGTTLVEQIIDAHPGAHGAGELRDLDEMAANLAVEIESSDPYPECVRDLEPQDIERLGRRYLDRLRHIASSARLVVNKSLANDRSLGLVAVLFPGARIICCRRDPRDTCLSCYMCGISPAAHPYITDLRHLGFAYRQHERLMDHWKRLGPSILDVEYEELVDDLEGQARRIIEFCGLEWDDNCLRFHATGRVVRTASYEQVRRPIYRSSIGRFQHFEAHLQPLMAALNVD